MGRYERGYYLFDNDFNVFKKNQAGQARLTGLLTGVGSSMNIVVSSGSAVVGSLKYDVGEATFTAASDPDNPKKGLVYMAPGGYLGFLMSDPIAASPSGSIGKRALTPSPPTLAGECLSLAEVWIPTNATTASQFTIFNYDNVPNQGSYWTVD